jgi:predicted TIM-barrel fold metal-dependent hydrolase
MINDAHCHFFSTPFFAPLGGDAALAKLGWDPPGTADELADRWVAALDAARVSRAALIASVPGDAASVGAAVRRHRDRFVGFFMVDPAQPGSPDYAANAIDTLGMRAICLFPAMHRFSMQDERVQRLFHVASARPGTAVFVHCGVLSVGVRGRLGLPSPFDMRFSNPLDLHAVALAHPDVTIIVPHFGAGLLREALMVADLCPNVMFDTSSSNGWMKYQPGLNLPDVFRQALAVAGPDRLLFGSDSSFFPRGWVTDVFEAQSAALAELGMSAEVREKVFARNFDRVFPKQPGGTSMGC